MLQSELITAVIWLVGGILVAFLARGILNNYIKKLFERTKTDLDDQIFGIVSAPIFNYVAITGLYFATQALSFFDRYEKVVNGAFFAISALIVAQVINRTLGVLIHSWLAVRSKQDKAPQLIIKIIAVAIYSLALIIILSHFGVQIAPIIAALGVGGLAIGLALKDTLSNIFSGLYIISDKPARVGDYIELQGGKIAGFVEDIGWRTTKIKTRRNDVIVIPNSQLAESVITNYDLIEKESSFTVECGVAYESNLEKIEKVTLEVAKKIQQTIEVAVKGHEPVVRFREFGDSNINFIVVLRAKNYIDKGRITHEFIKALKKRFDEEKIEISYPVRKIIK